MKGMVVCRIEASPPDAYKTYSVVDFDENEQAIYGIVNSLFRGDALIIKDLDYLIQAMLLIKASLVQVLKLKF